LKIIDFNYSKTHIQSTTFKYINIYTCITIHR
jgi:hypothetical protein